MTPHRRYALSVTSSNGRRPTSSPGRPIRARTLPKQLAKIVASLRKFGFGRCAIRHSTTFRSKCSCHFWQGSPRATAASRWADVLYLPPPPAPEGRGLVPGARARGRAVRDSRGSSVEPLVLPFGTCAGQHKGCTSTCRASTCTPQCAAAPKAARRWNKCAATSPPSAGQRSDDVNQRR